MAPRRMAQRAHAAASRALGGPAPAHPAALPSMLSAGIRPAAPVLLVAADPGVFGPAAGWLEAQGAGVVTCRDFGHAVAGARRTPLDWSCVLIDIDGFGGIDETFDGLRELRETAPRLPVIVLSRLLRVNDYSTERLALCDVSLRLPLSLAALELALVDAGHNNLIWQARQRATAV